MIKFLCLYFWRHILKANICLETSKKFSIFFTHLFVTKQIQIYRGTTVDIWISVKFKHFSVVNSTSKVDYSNLKKITTISFIRSKLYIPRLKHNFFFSNLKFYKYLYGHYIPIYQIRSNSRKQLKKDLTNVVMWLNINCGTQYLTKYVKNDMNPLLTTSITVSSIYMII